MTTTHTYIVGTSGLIKRLDDHTGGWVTVTPLPAFDWVIRDVMTDPYDPDKVYAVGEHIPTTGLPTGIIVSDNAGLSWTKPNGNWQNATEYHEVFVVNATTIWAVAIGGIVVKSTDGGINFNRVTTSPGGTLLLPWTPCIHALSDEIAIIAGSSTGALDDDGVLVYLTVDAGESWTTLNGTSTLSNSTTNPTGSPEGIYISEDQQTIIVTTNYAQFISLDGGLTFNDKPAEMTRSGAHLTWYPTYGDPTMYYHTGGPVKQINQSPTGSFWSETRGGEVGVEIIGAHLYDSTSGYYTDQDSVYFTDDNFVTGTLSDTSSGQTINAVWTGLRGRGYQLIDCNSQNNTLFSDDVILEDYIGQVVKVDIDGVTSDTCWTVYLWTDFPIDDTSITAVNEGYADCVTCLAGVPDSLGIPCDLTMRVGEPGFTTKHCDPLYVISLKAKYADAVYDMYKKLQYGIETCCKRDLDKIKLRHRLLELGEIFDPELCPPPSCEVCCDVAEDVVITAVVV